MLFSIAVPIDFKSYRQKTAEKSITRTNIVQELEELKQNSVRFLKYSVFMWLTMLKPNVTTLGEQ